MRLGMFKVAEVLIPKELQNPTEFVSDWLI
jgi:hypothetical protein